MDDTSEFGGEVDQLDPDELEQGIPYSPDQTPSETDQVAPYIPPVLGPPRPIRPRDAGYQIGDMVTLPALHPAFPGLERTPFDNLPVDLVAQAVAAAARYQSGRGYTRDLQAGLPAAQALARWAPTMFGQIANPRSLVQAQPKVVDIGGIGYVQMPDGSMKQVTPNKPVADPIEREYTADARRARVAMQRAEMILNTKKAKHAVVTPGDPGLSVLGMQIRAPKPESTTYEQTFPQQGIDEAQAAYDAAVEQHTKSQAVLQDYLKSRAAPQVAARPSFMYMGPKAGEEAARHPIAAPAVAAVAAAPETGGGQPLTREIGAQFLKQAGNNREKARELARKAGYTWPVRTIR